MREHERARAVLKLNAMPKSESEIRLSQTKRRTVDGRVSRRRFLSFSTAILTTACGGGAGPGGGNSPRGAVVDVIRRENAKTQGVTADWLIADQDYAVNPEIEGYASATSVNRGDSISLYVNTTDPNYTISVYRIGWYGGQGGRQVAVPIRRNGVRQPIPTADATTGLVECDWGAPYVLSIAADPSDPTDWASGIYLAKLTGSSGKQSYVIFVVRDDASNSALLFQSSAASISGSRFVLKAHALRRSDMRT